jgi:hypothetical protein
MSLNFKTKLSVLLLLPLLFTTVSCNKPTEPPTEDIPPGRRDYIWTVDTLNIPFTILESIWGSSPTNVWIVGPGGDLDKTIYHYNGREWKNDGISRNINPRTIWGFSSSDIWIGGANTFWHFNGNSWKEHTSFTIPDFTYCGIEDIWGDTPNNIYAVGYAKNNEQFMGLVMHYDGIKWQQSKIPMLEKYNFDRIRKGENTNYFMLGIRNEPFAADTMKMYELVNNDLKEIFSGGTTINSGGSFERIGQTMSFEVNRNICSYSSDNFNPFVKVNEINYGGTFWGRNKNDLFLRMQDGIAHYNGTDVEYLYNFEYGISISDAMIFEQDVFFLAYDFNNGLNLIIKGKIN